MKSRIKPFIAQIRKRRAGGAKDAAKALLSKPAGKLPTASAVLEAST